jgi:hypothetical protein
MNIMAREIEDHLVRHPAIANVAVVGMPDEHLGEKACAYVVLAEPSAALTLKDITAYLRAQKLATQKLPERLEIVSALPMTATGKVQKGILAQTSSRSSCDINRWPVVRGDREFPHDGRHDRSSPRAQGTQGQLCEANLATRAA